MFEKEKIYELSVSFLDTLSLACHGIQQHSCEVCQHDSYYKHAYAMFYLTLNSYFLYTLTTYYYQMDILIVI